MTGTLIAPVIPLLPRPVPPARLLRYANGRPITKKRYDYLWRRLGEHLPWVQTLQVSMYWIRHTTLTS